MSTETLAQAIEPAVVVSMSGGVASWAAARRAIARFGTDDMTLLFADTLIEDDDLHRFLRDVEPNLGLPIVRIAEGRTPWQVFRDRRFIGNTRVDPCSLVLKRELLRQWVTANKPGATVVIGIDWTETDRVPRIEAGWAPNPVWFPLIEDGVDKIQCFGELAAAGIRAPDLYAEGFPHNNCGGFCVKAGISQFVRLYRKRPALYAHHEAEEESLRVHLGKDVAILRDRRNGETKPMTMATLRQRIEAGERLPGDEWGGCGCALDDSPSQLALDLAAL